MKSLSIFKIIALNSYCRPNGSGEIAFKSVMRKLRQDFWRDMTFVCSCIIKFSRLYKFFNWGMYRPPKVLKLYVLLRRFQICKQNYCRPNGSGDIAFQSVMRKLRQDLWRDNTFVHSCLLKALYNQENKEFVWLLYCCGRWDSCCCGSWDSCCCCWCNLCWC